MKEVKGVYSSPCGKYWSSNPWTIEDYKQIGLYLNRKERRQLKRQKR